MADTAKRTNLIPHNLQHTVWVLSLLTVIPFGVMFAHVFYLTVNVKFNDISGFETDTDDILVWGKIIQEHNKNLEHVLKHMNEVNMTLNKD